VLVIAARGLDVDGLEKQIKLIIVMDGQQFCQTDSFMIEIIPKSSTTGATLVEGSENL
jgi:hypothetical protein